MAITVKIYLPINGGKEEIRRLNLDQHQTGYFQLYERIQQLFPSLNGRSDFSLSWRDPEGERISFSSDAEFQEAIGCLGVEDTILRIFINLPENSANLPLHVGVVCDKCEGTVKGIRYKCMQCPDFDLCHACEKAGVHSEHEMMRICTPKPRHGPQSPWGNFMPPQWMREWMRSARGGRYGGRGCHGARGRCGEQGQQTSNADKGAEKQPNSHEEFLRNIGENVAAMLDPLGISVDVDVEHNGERMHCGADANTCKSKEQRDEANRQAGAQPDVTAAAEKPADTADAPKTTEEPMQMDKDAATDNGWTHVIPSELMQNLESNQSTNSSGPQQATAPHSLYPDMTQQASRPRPMDPVIANALHQMESMGFDNDGGWLQSLLEAKNGDINAVFDAMQRQRPN